MDAILEAAAQVFAERGFAAGTTNRIAQRAGVSVGSLYEYFPNKESILVALVERTTAHGMAQIQARLGEDAEHPRELEALLAGFVQALLAFHRAEPELHRVLFEEAPHPPELHACVLQMEESLAHTLEAFLARCPDVHVEDPDTAAHLVVQLVEALSHRFALHGIHELGDAEFTAEVVRLLHAYLVHRPGEAMAPRR
ncbi:MAG: TetR/AcrR family transcriptional regulator [Myxococcota bacterium]